MRAAEEFDCRNRRRILNQQPDNETVSLAPPSDSLGFVWRIHSSHALHSSCPATCSSPGDRYAVPTTHEIEVPRPCSSAAATVARSSSVGSAPLMLARLASESLVQLQQQQQQQDPTPALTCELTPTLVHGGVLRYQLSDAVWANGPLPAPALPAAPIVELHERTTPALRPVPPTSSLDSSVSSCSGSAHSYQRHTRPQCHYQHPLEEGSLRPPASPASGSLLSASTSHSPSSSSSPPSSPSSSESASPSSSPPPPPPRESEGELTTATFKPISYKASKRQMAQLLKPILTPLKERRCRRSTLPQQATEVLFRWLGKHAHRPYPCEREKNALMKEAGISRVQVLHRLGNAGPTTSSFLTRVAQLNNWFINARRRILKPYFEDDEDEADEHQQQHQQLSEHHEHPPRT